MRQNILNMFVILLPHDAVPHNEALPHRNSQQTVGETPFGRLGARSIYRRRCEDYLQTNSLSNPPQVEVIPFCCLWFSRLSPAGLVPDYLRYVRMFADFTMQQYPDLKMVWPPLSREASQDWVSHADIGLFIQTNQ